jgi:hypothetical protein
MIIREIRTDELPLLETFFYEAIFVSENREDVIMIKNF